MCPAYPRNSAWDHRRPKARCRDRRALGDRRGARRARRSRPLGVQLVIVCDGCSARRHRICLRSAPAGNTAVAMRRFPACCWSISGSRFSSSGSKARCATPTASTGRRRREIGAAKHDRQHSRHGFHWHVGRNDRGDRSYILNLSHRIGFAARVAGGKRPRAKIGPPVSASCLDRLVFPGRRGRGLDGMIEVAASQGRTNANIAAGYGFNRHSRAFMARRISWRSSRWRFLIRRHQRQWRPAAAPDRPARCGPVLCADKESFVFGIRKATRCMAAFGSERKVLKLAERIRIGSDRAVPLFGAASAGPRQFCSSARRMQSPNGRGINSQACEGTLCDGRPERNTENRTSRLARARCLPPAINGALLGARHARDCSLPRVNDVAVALR